MAVSDDLSLAKPVPCSAKVGKQWFAGDTPKLLVYSGLATADLRNTDTSKILVAFFIGCAWTGSSYAIRHLRRISIIERAIRENLPKYVGQSYKHEATV